MGWVFLIAGVASGIVITDRSRVWRIAWISIASLVGILWIWTGFRVKQGSRSARWASIPFLVVSFPSLPILGWITVPIVVYIMAGHIEHHLQILRERYLV